MRHGLTLLLALAIPAISGAQRWNMTGDGGISWTVGDTHTDHLEMAGKGIAAIITYGTDASGGLVLDQELVFPTLRILPNDTRGSLTVRLRAHVMDSVLVDGEALRETPLSFYIRGCLGVHSRTQTPVVVNRTAFPSVDKRAYIEYYSLTNTGTSVLHVHIPSLDSDSTTAPGAEGAYVINRHIYDSGDYDLAPWESLRCSLVISGRRVGETPYPYSAAYEWSRRLAFVDDLGHSLVLRTPNDTVDRMFGFAKIRAAESIYDTRSGLMHSPGGGEYYAAIWANDQAEYVDPFFPFLGNAAGNESARNSFRLFAAYMNPDYKPIPSSIIAEGLGYWNGAGDRGDEAMIAYGASRFALSGGDTMEAHRLWPLISWCLEYLRRRKTSDGVIASESDELEGRFPSGKINLSTNVLAYGGFLYAGYLAGALGMTNEAGDLEYEAYLLHNAIEKYFAATVQGYDTYRYYEGNDRLRSWISLPLVMGLFDRREGTVQALLSPYLWSPNGILTESGSTTYWDRATLYAFRGLFYAGKTDTCLRYFSYYSRMRLLGEHVPYAVEAWPEGNQRHLSAESALYCRAVTEGLFGIQPLGFKRFSLTPRLPAAWDSMSLTHIRAFGSDFAIRVVRVPGPTRRVPGASTGASGATRVQVRNGDRLVLDTAWDGGTPLVADLDAIPPPSPGVTFTSTDTALQRIFAWSKAMALHYRGKPSDPVGPWYESALPPRDAFCMRDVSHMCIGGEILGLSVENKNMFTHFAENISASRDWCSFWEIDKWNRPCPADYKSDREFWYNLPANFDVFYATWRLANWTGDSSYLTGTAFVNFGDRTMHEYIRSWVLEPDSLLTRSAHSKLPVPTYFEGVGNPKIGVDIPAVMYRALTTYAITRDSPSFARLAERYRARLESEWWDNKDSLYYTFYSNADTFGRTEGETWLLYWDALRDSARIRRTLDHLASVTWNVEGTSHLPVIFYRLGRWDRARKYIDYLSNPGTERREYPEVCFGVLEGIVQGLMGVDVVPGTRIVSTQFRSSGGDTSALTNLPILGTFLTLRHEGPRRSFARNDGNKAITWRPCFTGFHARASVAGRQVVMQHSPGISYVDVELPPGKATTCSAD